MATDCRYIENTGMLCHEHTGVGLRGGDCTAKGEAERLDKRIEQAIVARDAAIDQIGAPIRRRVLNRLVRRQKKVSRLMARRRAMRLSHPTEQTPS